MRDAGEWLDRRGLADYISARVDELPRLQRAHKLPVPSYHLGPKSPRWRRKEVDDMFSGVSGPSKPTMEQAVANVVQNILSRRSRRPQGHGRRDH